MKPETPNPALESIHSRNKTNNPNPNMIVTTTFTVEGCSIVEYKGLVRGIIVRAPAIAQGFLGGLKNIIGGRIGAYTEMCEQARQTAYDEMVEHAKQLGANAIVGARYDASARDLPPKFCATERRLSLHEHDKCACPSPLNDNQ